MVETKVKTTRTKKAKTPQPTEAATRLYAPLPDKPLVFMHIPKTGGHTLRAVLQEVYGAALCPAQNWDELHTVDVSAYRVFIGHFGRQIETLLNEIPDYVVFLREPRERMLSLFAYLRETLQIDPMLTLMEYLETVAPARGDVDQITAYLSVDRNPDLAIDMLHDECLFVGRFENLEADINRLAEVLNWPAMPVVPHLNQLDGRRLNLSNLTASEYEALAFKGNSLDTQVYQWAVRYLWAEQ